MCGIAAIFAREHVAQDLYDALTILQHRGQDAAGIVTCEDERLTRRAKNGLVRDVFRTRHMLKLRGHMGIGHVRYPTAGTPSSVEAQPLYVNTPFGVTLAHNGNLINAAQLKRDLFLEDLRHVNTDSDSEVLLNVFAHELQVPGKTKLGANDVFRAVEGVHRRCVGGYAAVAMVVSYGIVGFRDPYGVRPLCLGQRETSQGMEYMFASESVALDALGFELVRDLAPGEAVYIDAHGNAFHRQCSERSELCPCIFEYVYLARPDSLMDDISVHKARLRMGEKLADRISSQWPDHDIDVVIPVPDTSRTAALPLAHRLGVKFREGFVKNRYIGRTFIMPGQSERKRSVRHKLNPVRLEFANKNVLLVDDSIVRGNTSSQIIEMAREAGARKVYMASAAPAVRYQNVYGIDMPTAGELIAHDRTDEDVAEAIGADRLFYQTLEDLEDSVRRGNPRISRFDTSCFNGAYVTGGVSEKYLEVLAGRRNDEAKLQHRETADLREHLAAIDSSTAA